MASHGSASRRLEHQAFPKTCPVCGKVYRDEIQFFQETQALVGRPSGTRPIHDDPDVDHLYLEVYRNCACGTTLMERFHSRRDLSPAGLARRAAFEEVLGKLTLAGLSREAARLQLLRLIGRFTGQGGEASKEDGGEGGI